MYQPHYFFFPPVSSEPRRYGSNTPLLCSLTHPSGPVQVLSLVVNKNRPTFKTEMQNRRIPTGVLGLLDPTAVFGNVFIRPRLLSLHLPRHRAGRAIHQPRWKIYQHFVGSVCNSTKYEPPSRQRAAERKRWDSDEMSDISHTEQQHLTKTHLLYTLHFQMANGRTVAF